MNTRTDNSLRTAPRRITILRTLISTPFYLLGGFYCLLFVRMPQRLSEAWQRHAVVGWNGILADTLFADSLWRCTVIPLTGLGLVTLALGITLGKRRVAIGGLIWTIAIFCTGSALLR